MSLREEHRALTDRKIVDAVLELVAEGSLDELSVPAVSKRSGVSVATIYRYYRTKDELLAAAAAEPARRALANHAPGPAPDDELAGFQAAMWAEFAKNLPLLRHQVTSAAGREMRMARLEESRRRLAEYLARYDIDAQSPAGRRLVSLLLLVSGSLALVELHDRQGLTVDDALDVSQWAEQALIDATVKEGVIA
jgi:TetR/AcrR family transcriptional regulator, cholesterol catabolism regulator